MWKGGEGSPYSRFRAESYGLLAKIKTRKLLWSW